MAAKGPSASNATDDPNPNLTGGGAKKGGLKGPDMARLEAILRKFEVTIAEANDLVLLSDYEIAILADDSGSMRNAAAPAKDRRLGQTVASRWDELRETVGLIIDLGACFDPDGLDLYFLNRPKLSNVKSSTEKSLMNAFERPPDGGTPLTEKLRELVQSSRSDRPTLLFILTDGEPSGGVSAFRQELRNVVKKKITNRTFKVQIMACTSEDDAVGWLNEVDREFQEVDVTDDYYSERAEVLAVRKTKAFTRGDWCMKAMLGPISSKFDGWDEKPAGAGSSSFSNTKTKEPHHKQEKDEKCAVS